MYCIFHNTYFWAAQKAEWSKRRNWRNVREHKTQPLVKKVKKKTLTDNSKET